MPAGGEIGGADWFMWQGMGHSPPPSSLVNYCRSKVASTAAHSPRRRGGAPVYGRETVS
jgi:hypothetical protein